MPFLMNDQLIDPSAMANPINNPAFPLSWEAFARITIPDIAELAKAEFLQDPEFPRTQPEVAERIAGMITAKQPINAMRIQKAAGGPDAVAVDFARLNIAAMAEVHGLNIGGKLTLEAVNQGIWAQVETMSFGDQSGAVSAGT